jgi:hypothetical protein
MGHGKSLIGFFAARFAKTPRRKRKRSVGSGGGGDFLEEEGENEGEEGREGKPQSSIRSAHEK